MSYQPNLNDVILVVAPHYNTNTKSVIYTYTQNGSVMENFTCLETTSFVEQFLYLQGTSIIGSRESARVLYNFSKNIPLYAPITQQVIHQYVMEAAPDPIYFFTSMYEVTELAKKRCQLTLHSLSFIVKASKKQCVSRRDRISHYLMQKLSLHSPIICKP
ncbi:hypothetical protein A6K76_09610 [Caryophanon latum]|uniref:Uncharacterized protein n=2 Tax=Caryophanon latum TaxID=33977 RepID=A0A1C0YVR3_9BACL|nr:hypothetical protein A6K76_09610 [Caryophanon latum]